MKYQDVKELYIDLMAKEALEIPDELNVDYKFPRKEIIKKLVKYLDIMESHSFFFKENTKITIRFYNKINTDELFEADTARGKEMPIIFSDSTKNTFVYIIDNEGRISEIL